MPNFRMLDLRAETPRRNVSANFATVTGFKGPSDTSHWRRIDFIFGGSNKGWWVLFLDGWTSVLSLFFLWRYRTSNSYMVRSVLSDDGMLASDHRPVFADISLQPTR